MNNRKLSNYFLYPAFQVSLVTTNVVITTGCLLLVNYKIYSAFERIRVMGVEAQLPPSHPYFEFVGNTQKIITTNINWALAISLFISTMASIYLSHKAVGPIHRLRMYFTSIEKGEKMGEVRFRKGDYFSDLPPLINSALKKIVDK